MEENFTASFYKASLLKKLKLWRLLRKKPNNSQVKLKFKRAAKALKSAIIKWRLEKERALITPINKSSFFKYINSKLNINKHVSGLLKDDGTFTSDPFEIAQMLNDYFASVYTIDNGINSNFEKRKNSELGSVLFSGQSVHHALMEIKRSHSSGPDGIPNVLLKSMAQVLSKPLALFFERNMIVVFILKILKTTRIVPILKKGSPLKASNYRLKSLTSTVSKEIERIITDQLMSYLSYNSLAFIFSNVCFQKNSSTIIQLLDCYNDWSAAQNAGNNVDIIYLDFAKAFHNVVHSKLLLKLAAYGISGNLLAWIKCFLIDRSHFIFINNASSVSQSVLSDIPQETVHGWPYFVHYLCE